MEKTPTALVILDGFGYRKDTLHNAIAHAKTPSLDYLFTHYPSCILHASGRAVGLPQGAIGNSEVGHLTIGSGRIVQQPSFIINQALQDKTLHSNPTLITALKMLKKNTKTLHIMGLLSDADVHSNENFLYSLLEIAVQQGITKIIVHAFLDGRDVAPKSAQKHLQKLHDVLQKLGHGILGSVHGRFYAMDRDNNWERTQASYKALTEPQPITHTNWQEVIKKNYDENITDEFIPPTQLSSAAVVQNGDGIIFFNFRPDRARQLTASFVDPSFKTFSTKRINPAFFITPTNYNSKLKTTVLFKRTLINNTLKDVLSQHNKTIFCIAETEKYAHVTYFFNGQQETPVKNETRVLTPSIVAQDYVATPEMSAPKITTTVLESLRTNPHDFYLINYANADMVGHSGNFDATVKAIECLDREVKKLYEELVEKMDGTLFITADHGNAEQMFDPDIQQPRTAHTTNGVPFIMIKKGLAHKKLALAQLSDVAPFILKHLQIPVPKEME